MNIKNLQARFPSSITGFFSIRKHKNLLKKGSLGAGVVIEEGVKTQIKISKSTSGRLEIHTYINNRECECATTKRAVQIFFDKFADKLDIEIPCRIDVFHEINVPIAQGFGTSAGMALGVVKCLNDFFNIKLTLKDVGDIAHLAEVLEKTGLGSVVGELSRGIFIRLKEGAPSVANVESIRYEGFFVCAKVGEPILTKNIISRKSFIKKINKIGDVCLKEFIKEKTPKNFLKLSRYFAQNLKIGSKEVFRKIKILENRGYIFSQTMIGNYIFTLTEEPEEVLKVLEDENLKGHVYKVYV